jgi:hypothetical protein
MPSKARAAALIRGILREAEDLMHRGGTVFTNTFLNGIVFDLSTLVLDQLEVLLAGPGIIFEPVDDLADGFTLASGLVFELATMTHDTFLPEVKRLYHPLL